MSDEIKCPRDGGTDFYIARFYSATELRTVKGIRRNDDGDIETWVGDTDSDEYSSIDKVELMCSACYLPVAEIDETNITFDPIEKGHKGWNL